MDLVGLHRIVDGGLELEPNKFYPIPLLRVEVSDLSVVVFAAARDVRGGVYGLALTTASSGKDLPILVRRYNPQDWRRVEKYEVWMIDWIAQNPTVVNEDRKRVSDLLISE